MSNNTNDVVSVEKLGEARDIIIKELRKKIVGMEDVIEEMLIAIFAQGHVLLVGVPGLAKTLLVSSLSEALSLDFKRIQFTPDLMPSDITGTELLQEDPETHERRFKFMEGPVFTNLLLADEINRTPPKTQAALLEAMQEKKITSGGVNYDLAKPFFVLATQNPIEQEGTYALPEAQLDRFLFNVQVMYPSHDEEIEVMKNVTGVSQEAINKVIDGEQILEFQKLIKTIPVADHIMEYVASIVRSTRPNEPEAPQFVREMMGWGAGPRASINLIMAGKSRAALHGRAHVAIEDIKALALPVLRHRVIPNFAARSEGMTSDSLITRLIEEIPVDEKLYQK